MKDSFLRLCGSRILSALLLIVTSCGLGVLSLRFAASFEPEQMYASYFENNWITVLNVLPCVWLSLLLWFATRRTGLAFALSSIVVMGFTLTSWMKLQFRNDPLLFEDILLAKEAGNMTEQYQLFVTRGMILAAIILLVTVAGLAVFARYTPAGRVRLIGIGVLLALLIPASMVYTDSAVYTVKTANNKLISQWSSTQLYISKGFVYPFLHSIGDSFDSPPAGYQAKEAKTRLADYSDAEIPTDKKVDLIGIMLEAYADLSVYDQIEMTDDPYAVYHQLEREGVSGNLLTNIFAGGTVDTERCFLTGYANLGSFRVPTNSYVRYFADQGYTVTGSHPSFDWFYNRVNINRNLGFESYNFVENHYGAFTDGDTAMDNVLFPELMRLHDEALAQSDKPYFAFNVTYQGHGPYTRDRDDYAHTYVKPGVYTAETEHILNNYFGSIADTNAYLKDFFDHYRASDRPVVIVLFGDHKPWLGDGSTVYQELGIDLHNRSSQEGFYDYYGTRYLIWANDAAKTVLDQDFHGEGRDLGPYFLMDDVFQLCGWQGPAFMQAARSTGQAVPVISRAGLYLQNGQVTASLTEENAQLVREYLTLEYYQRKNFQSKEKETR